MKNLNSRMQVSKDVRSAIRRGSLIVGMPSILIMMGIWLVGALLTGPFNNNIVFLIAFPLGFGAGWLWWSYTVPRWRKWALEQPGVDPDELQAAAEAAQLVWPKGHFFEKTEIRPKD